VVFQLSSGGAVRIMLASVSSSIHAICSNMERRHDCEVRLLSYLRYLIIANKLMPLDSKQRSQAPLIKSVNTEQVEEENPRRNWPLKWRCVMLNATHHCTSVASWLGIKTNTTHYSQLVVVAITKRCSQLLARLLCLRVDL